MKITYVLILLSMVVFAYGFTVDSEQFYGQYAFSHENFLARPYVIITSIFLHGSLLHLLSNALAWMFFGTAVEDELGPLQMMVIFFLGAFAGDFLSLLAYSPDTLSIGASAGIFALVGVGMLVRPMDLSMYPLVVPLPLAFIGLLYAIYNAYEFLFAGDPGISYVAHFGGLVVGLYFGFKHAGLRKGLKIIVATLTVMILIPIAYLLLTGQMRI